MTIEQAATELRAIRADLSRFDGGFEDGRHCNGQLAALAQRVDRLAAVVEAAITPQFQNQHLVKMVREAIEKGLGRKLPDAPDEPTVLNFPP